MNVTDLRANIGKFGMLKAGEKGYKKTIHGHLKDLDTRGSIWFVDTDGYGYCFKNTNIDSFEVKEFAPLPDKYNGSEIYWDAGKAYYKDTKRECDLKK